MSALTVERPLRRPPQSRRVPPLPPRWLPNDLAIDRQPLWQFVILSILLHALAILLFGAPAGGSREGRAMWGSLQVMLRPAPTPLPPPEPMAFPKLPEIKVDPLPPMMATPKPSEVKVPPPPTPVIAPLPEPLPQIREPVTLPKMEAVPAIRIPAEVPKMPAPLVQPLPAPSIERSALPSLAPIPEIRAPVEAPPLPSQLTQPLPQLQEHATLPPIDARTFEPAAPAAPQPGRPDAERAPETPSFRQAPETRRPAEPSRDYDPTKPSLDPEALRKRAGDLAREGSGRRSVFAFPMPVPPKPRTKLEDAIEKARKPDCRNAYKDLGLAAVVPLLANEFGEGTCRW